MPLYTDNDDAARSFSRAVLLSEFRAASRPLDQAESAHVTEQLTHLLEDYYVHLPLKRSSLGIDPVQETSILKSELDFLPNETEFHRRLFGILKRLRDRHTAVRLPSPWREAVAFLPFAVESFFADGRRRVLVSMVMGENEDPQFVDGVEITHWNGIEIGRCIELLSWTTEGANPYARIAIALRSMTARPLAYMPMPDEDWVTLTYLGSGGERTLVIPWRVYFPDAQSSTAAANTTASSEQALTKGLDRSTLLVNSAWYDLYVPRGASADARSELTVDPRFSDLVQVKVISSRAHEWGYVRVFSFEVDDPAAFVSALARLLQELPQRGVVIDIRGNPGGSITAGEGFLALFAKDTPSLQRLSFRNTRGTQLLGSLAPFQPWSKSINMQIETGDLFSQAHALTDVTEWTVDVYRGAVVVIVDALSYSASDFLAAGLQDNGIAQVLGVDPVTGAGGANVWSHSALSELVAAAGGTDITPLPGNFDIDLSVRRSSRVGSWDGIPVEGLGVLADTTYQLTREDVLGDNSGLLDFAAHLLETAQPR